MSVYTPPPKRNMPLDDCANCRYKEPADGGHCYMFKEPPAHWCLQHQRFEGKGAVIMHLFSGDNREKRGGE